MTQHHKSFWVDLAGKIGPALFAATAVGCLLEGRITLTHVALTMIALMLIATDHWYVFHRRNPDG